jgi:gamma-glutamyltranspeptidase/glutathione hydrolase
MWMLMPRRRPRVAAALLLVTCAFAVHAQDMEPESASGRTDRAAARSRSFMVAAANPLAVETGYRILRQGGSAVDAAIAVQFVLNVVEPQSSGIGGGGFMLVHDARRGRLVAYDGRETAPAAARPDRFLDADGKPLRFFDAVIGGRSVGVPGTVALLAETHKRHGRLPWARLLAPAIEIAERGFAISPRLALLIAAEQQRFVQPRARAYFLEPDGSPRKAGTMLRNPALAKTLRAIAAGGAAAFYRGPIAQDIVATANGFAPNPGDLTLADLARYEVKVRAPVCGPYRVYWVCGMPPPSSGGIAVLQMLGILEPYDVAAMRPATFWSVHFMSEAGRLAFADRGAYVADPDFVAVPPGLLDRDYLRERSQLVRVDASLGTATPGDPPDPSARKAARGATAALEAPSTSHVSIVDDAGNAVALTTTIEWGFGSHLMTEGGFLLNNELTDFSLVPEANGAPVANRVEPGKRPRSSMAPTIAYDAAGRIYMVVGSGGGSAIVNHVVKTLLGVLDWGLDPQAAVALPNFGSRNGPTELEAGTSVAALAPRLEALGHRVDVRAESSGTQAIVRAKDGWIGGADPRREGTAMGD